MWDQKRVAQRTRVVAYDNSLMHLGLKLEPKLMALLRVEVAADNTLFLETWWAAGKTADSNPFVEVAADGTEELQELVVENMYQPLVSNKLELEVAGAVFEPFGVVDAVVVMVAPGKSLAKCPSFLWMGAWRFGGQLAAVPRHAALALLNNNPPTVYEVAVSCKLLQCTARCFV